MTAPALAESRVAEVVRRIRRDRDAGLVVHRVRLSPATRAELAAAQPVDELVGIETQDSDEDIDVVESRLPARAGRGRGRR